MSGVRQERYLVHKDGLVSARVPRVQAGVFCSNQIRFSIFSLADTAVVQLYKTFAMLMWI